MYKKIGLSFLALILVFNYSMKEYADAAVVTKVATQAAKQVAQEVVKDIAVETAFKMALDEVGKIYDSKNEYKFKPGFHGYCVEVKKPDGSCDKPIQIKSELTETDKQAIKGQAGTELDKVITGGTGMSKWAKFMDWFLPVWLVSFGATALTYAFDSDVRDLFNEAGYNALVSLGFIVPMATRELTDIEAVEKPVIVKDGENEKIEGMYNLFSNGHVNTTLQSNVKDVVPALPVENTMVHTAFNGYYAVSERVSSYSVNLNDQTHYGFNSSFFYLYPSVYEGLESVTYKVMDSSRNVVSDGTANGSLNASTMQYPLGQFVGFPMGSKTYSSIDYRLPYEIDGYMYSDIYMIDNKNEALQIQIKHTGFSIENIEKMGFRAKANSTYFDVEMTLMPNIPPLKQILIPTYEELSKDTPVMSSSVYENGSGNVALIPPTALTYKEESTGETVYRVPAAIPTEPAQFQKEDGTIVPEENITVDPAPTVTPAPTGITTEKGEPIPEGTPIVTPAPTPTNPAPAPIPLTPTEPAPNPSDPTTPPPANGEEPPMEPFPEGESCQEKLKFPIFSPLKEQFSTSFPFSIPWDMERAINAAFAEIGNDRPEFTLDLAFMGETKEIKIGVPKFFDNWKPFTDTLLLLTFDILIMFGVYRFVKGAGS